MMKYFKSLKEFIPTWFICIFIFFWINIWAFIIGIILIIVQIIQLKEIKKKLYDYEYLLNDYNELSKEYDEIKSEYEKLYRVYTETISRYIDIDCDNIPRKENDEELKENLHKCIDNDEKISTLMIDYALNKEIDKIEKKDIEKDFITEEKLENQQENTDCKEQDSEKDNTDLESKVGNGFEEKREYRFPPLNLLVKGRYKENDDSKRELMENAKMLQQTLATFGVNVTIIEISQGPSVTRFEMQPEQGVKVSKILGLTNDIKLNLSAKDIRIEAPIPGKAAIAIEIPNREKSIVAIRDLLESREFKEFPSNVAIVIGEDICGRIVIADIAKMPHLLIAGTTGSGKSVFIDSIIMSIIYKAHPDDVKIIMIDSKGSTLNVYNGIPHLLIPVITDPKKAPAALHWGVAEMNDRYKKLADFGVKNLKDYNKKIDILNSENKCKKFKKIPQILIIIDDLSDLMAVKPIETEENIVRLAQMARAAGIHLVISTQRPSTNVITGLIKANIPSRIAFSVFSTIDSRVILDEKGAEELSGNGDMLFKPMGYTRPARIQGAYVSDREVSDVVDFLKNQAIGDVYSKDIKDKIKNMKSSFAESDAYTFDSGFKYDPYFAEAGRFVIDKDKASIGMLQRVYKIGFNRAARIMDELCEAGVVGEEEGTRPRKILMSLDEFEKILE